MDFTNIKIESDGTKDGTKIIFNGKDLQHLTDTATSRRVSRIALRQESSNSSHNTVTMPLISSYIDSANARASA